MDLAITAGVQRADTAATLEAEAVLFSSADGDEAGRVVGPDTSARLRELREHAREVLVPALQDAECEIRLSTVLMNELQPRIHLSLSSRRPVGGRVVFFVRVPLYAPVIWVDGSPEGLAAFDGWGVVTAPIGSVTLCAATASADRCDAAYRVIPAMGDAYDLRQALQIRDADLRSLPPASPTP
jgi:hypothetical protein